MTRSLDAACYDFFQLIGEKSISFDEKGIAAYVDMEGQLIRLEKKEDDLFLEFNPGEKKLARDDMLRFLQRANLRSQPPFPFHVAWLNEEKEPRMIVHLSGTRVNGPMILDALGFLKRLVG